MTIKNKQKRNFIWNALGLTFNSFNSLFFLIIVELINGLDIAGIFTYAFSLCCLFYALSIYYNRTFQVSDKHNRFSFSDYLTARIILSVVSLILIVVFSLISQFDGYKILVIFLIMLFRVVESISDCFYGFIQKKGDLYKTGISLTLKAVIGLAGFLVLDLITGNLLFSIVSLIVINLIFFWCYDFKNYRKLTNEKINFELKNVCKIIKKCFPVFVFSALSIYLANCQKYVMTYYEPNDMQTIFGILIMPATVLSLLGSYLINPFINNLTDLFQEKKIADFVRKTTKILAGLILMGLLVLIFLAVVGIPIINFIYQLHLDEYWFEFILILVASIFYAVAMVVSSFLTILKENSRQSIIYFIVSIIATIMSIVLIISNGVRGAVFAFLLTGVLLSMCYIALFIVKIKYYQREN